jgi:hypothetical protein
VESFLPAFLLVVLYSEVAEMLMMVGRMGSHPLGIRRRGSHQACCLVLSNRRFYFTRHSSVGRAVDCRGVGTKIHRSLVQFRLTRTLY